MIFVIVAGVVILVLASQAHAPPPTIPPPQLAPPSPKLEEAFHEQLTAPIPPGPSFPSIPVPSPSPEGPISPAPTLVDVALDAARKGTATPELLVPAIEAAKDAGAEKTAEALTVTLDKTITETIPAIVSQKDRPGWPIPLDPDTGKSLWFADTRGGIRMMIPRFRSILVQFQTLQQTIGVDDDGRIGPGTLAKFISIAEKSGHARHPVNIDQLAANAVKWTEILRKNIPSEKVGYVASPFDWVSDEKWSEFIGQVSSDYSDLIDRVKEKLGSWIGKSVDGSEVTLSGLLGITTRAGTRGAQRWLESSDDRKRFPATTKAFQQTNGLF